MPRQIVKVVRNCARTNYHKTGLASILLLGLALIFGYHEIKTPPAFLSRAVLDFLFTFSRY